MHNASHATIEEALTHRDGPEGTSSSLSTQKNLQDIVVDLNKHVELLLRLVGDSDEAVTAAKRNVVVKHISHMLFSVKQMGESLGILASQKQWTDEMNRVAEFEAIFDALINKQKQASVTQVTEHNNANKDMSDERSSLLTLINVSHHNELVNQEQRQNHEQQQEKKVPNKPTEEETKENQTNDSQSTLPQPPQVSSPPSPTVPPPLSGTVPAPRTNSSPKRANFTTTFSNKPPRKSSSGSGTRSSGSGLGSGASASGSSHGGVGSNSVSPPCHPAAAPMSPPLTAQTHSSCSNNTPHSARVLQVTPPTGTSPIPPSSAAPSSTNNTILNRIQPPRATGATTSPINSYTDSTAEYQSGGYDGDRSSVSRGAGVRSSSPMSNAPSLMNVFAQHQHLLSNVVSQSGHVGGIPPISHSPTAASPHSTTASPFGQTMLTHYTGGTLSNGNSNSHTPAVQIPTTNPGSGPSSGKHTGSSGNTVISSNMSALSHSPGPKSGGNASRAHHPSDAGNPHDATTPQAPAAAKFFKNSNNQHSSNINSPLLPPFHNHNQHNHSGAASNAGSISYVNTIQSGYRTGHIYNGSPLHMAGTPMTTVTVTTEECDSTSPCREGNFFGASIRSPPPPFPHHHSGVMDTSNPVASGSFSGSPHGVNSNSTSNLNKVYASPHQYVKKRNIVGIEYFELVDTDGEPDGEPVYAIAQSVSSLASPVNLTGQQQSSLASPLHLQNATASDISHAQLGSGIKAEQTHAFVSNLQPASGNINPSSPHPYLRYNFSLNTMMNETSELSPSHTRSLPGMTNPSSPFNNSCSPNFGNLQRSKSNMSVSSGAAPGQSRGGAVNRGFAYSNSHSPLQRVRVSAAHSPRHASSTVHSSPQLQNQTLGSFAAAVAQSSSTSIAKRETSHQHNLIHMLTDTASSASSTAPSLARLHSGHSNNYEGERTSVHGQYQSADSINRENSLVVHSPPRTNEASPNFSHRPPKPTTSDGGVRLSEGLLPESGSFGQPSSDQSERRNFGSPEIRKTDSEHAHDGIFTEPEIEPVAIKEYSPGPKIGDADETPDDTIMMKSPIRAIETEDDPKNLLPHRLHISCNDDVQEVSSSTVVCDTSASSPRRAHLSLPNAPSPIANIRKLVEQSEPLEGSHEPEFIDPSVSRDISIPIVPDGANHENDNDNASENGKANDDDDAPPFGSPMPASMTSRPSIAFQFAQVAAFKRERAERERNSLESAIRRTDEMSEKKADGQDTATSPVGGHGLTGSPNGVDGLGDTFNRATVSPLSAVTNHTRSSKSSVGHQSRSTQSSDRKKSGHSSSANSTGHPATIIPARGSQNRNFSPDASEARNSDMISPGGNVRSPVSSNTLGNLSMDTTPLSGDSLRRPVTNPSSFNNRSPSCYSRRSSTFAGRHPYEHGHPGGHFNMASNWPTPTSTINSIVRHVSQSAPRDLGSRGSGTSNPVSSVNNGVGTSLAVSPFTVCSQQTGSHTGVGVRSYRTSGSISNILSPGTTVTNMTNLTPITDGSIGHRQGAYRGAPGRQHVHRMREVEEENASPRMNNIVINNAVMMASLHEEEPTPSPDLHNNSHTEEMDNTVMNTTMNTNTVSRSHSPRNMFTNSASSPLPLAGESSMGNITVSLSYSPRLQVTHSPRIADMTGGSHDNSPSRKAQAEKNGVDRDADVVDVQGHSIATAEDDVDSVANGEEGRSPTSVIQQIEAENIKAIEGIDAELKIEATPALETGTAKSPEQEEQEEKEDVSEAPVVDIPTNSEHREEPDVAQVEPVPESEVAYPPLMLPLSSMRGPSATPRNIPVSPAYGATGAHSEDALVTVTQQGTINEVVGNHEHVVGDSIVSPVGGKSMSTPLSPVGGLSQAGHGQSMSSPGGSSSPNNIVNRRVFQSFFQSLVANARSSETSRVDDMPPASPEDPRRYADDARSIMSDRSQRQPASLNLPPFQTFSNGSMASQSVLAAAQTPPLVPPAMLSHAPLGLEGGMGSPDSTPAPQVASQVPQSRDMINRLEFSHESVAGWGDAMPSPSPLNRTHGYGYSCVNEPLGAVQVTTAHHSLATSPSLRLTGLHGHHPTRYQTASPSCFSSPLSVTSASPPIQSARPRGPPSNVWGEQLLVQHHQVASPPHQAYQSPPSLTTPNSVASFEQRSGSESTAHRNISPHQDFTFSQQRLTTEAAEGSQTKLLGSSSGSDRFASVALFLNSSDRPDNQNQLLRAESHYLHANEGPMSTSTFPSNDGLSRSEYALNQFAMRNQQQQQYQQQQQQYSNVGAPLPVSAEASPNYQQPSH